MNIEKLMVITAMKAMKVAKTREKYMFKMRGLLCWKSKLFAVTAPIEVPPEL